MSSNFKVGAISALCGLIVGLLLGFLPQQAKISGLQGKLQSAEQAKQTADQSVEATQRKLRLSNFAVRSARLSTEAEQNNYSVAADDASALFTDLRQYEQSTDDAQVKSALDQVLGVRDETIAALAKANPAVKGQLQQIFLKLQSLVA